MSAGRVLLLPSAFSPHQGGVEELTLRLAQELAKNQPSPIVLTNRWPRDLPGHAHVEGIEVFRHPMRPGPGRGLRGRALAGQARLLERRLVSTLQQRGIGLVHVQCVSNQSYLAQRIARQLNVPLVVTLQGELTMDATGIYQTSAMMAAWHRLLDAADAVSGCSQYVIDEARAAHPSLREDAIAIANGVHTAAQPPAKSAEPYLFAVGRHVPQKGFDILLQALARTRTPHKLAIGGDGTMRPELERLAGDVGLADRVRFLGALPHDEVLAWCAGAQAFVLPSRHEPQGIVVLEAMSVGTLVLAADVGGVPEMVRPGETGFLFAGSDPDALADLIDREVGRDRSDILERARRTAQAHSWAAVTSRYEELYERARITHAEKFAQAR